MAMVPDKRPRHRPTGCAGILFQLFDWNRRRRLFPKRRLLPSPKPDLPIPIAKLILIAEENRGGFPSAKRPPEPDAKRSAGMCSPGLVARLMGLETMPADAARERPRRAVDSACSGPENSADSRHDLNLEVGARTMTTDVRPQKLRKTGEVVQFGKRKLASPVKSPRTRGSTRLIEAAARILEPGLQRRSRARYAVTYRGPVRGDAGCSELPLLLKSDESAGRGYVGSCRSCGSLVEVADLEPQRNEIPPAGCRFEAEIGKRSPSSLEFDNVGKLKVGVSDERCPVAGPLRELDNVGKLKGASNAGDARAYPAHTQGKVSTFTRSDELAQRKGQLQNNRRVTGGAKEDLLVRGTIKQNSISQNQKMTVGDKPAMRRDAYNRQRTGRGLTSTSSSMSPGLVAASKKQDIHTHKRTTSRSSASVNVESETGLWERMAMGQRSRLSNGSRVSSSTTAKPYMATQRNVRPQNVVPARVAALASTSSVSKNHQRNNARRQAVSKDAGVMSFTFKAPFRHGEESLSSDDVEKDTRSLSNSLNEGVAQRRDSMADSSTVSVPSRMVTTLTSDELGALLEQKIRELNSLHQAAVDGENVNKSTASILEELIFALTKGGPSCQKEADTCQAGVSPIEGHSYGSPRPPDTDAHGCNVNAHEISPVLSPEVECNQPSPVSILEASFSAGSSTSESIFSTSEESWGKSQLWDPYSDFLDPATFGGSVVIESGNVSLSLEDISPMYGTRGCFGFSKVRPNFAREVILNTELFLRCFAEDREDAVESPIDVGLLGILEILCAEFDGNPEYASFLSDVNSPHPDQTSLRRFLFDCIIEKMNMTNKQHWRSCCMSTKKLPPVLRENQLMGEIRDDISKRRNSAGKTFDEIIEGELKHPTEKWDNFEGEAFEAGMDIEHHLFQALVDEMTLDLLPR